MDAFNRSKNLMRLIALVLAIMLWAVVRTGSDSNTALPSPATPSQGQKTTATITGTPEVQFDSNKVALIGNVPEIAVLISGQLINVKQAQLISSTIHMTADARGLGEGMHDVPVQVAGLPPDVTFQPQTVAIRLEAIQQQNFSVSVAVDGTHTPEQLDQLTISPKEITATGPKSLLQQITKLQVRTAPEVFDQPGVKRTTTVQALNDAGKPLAVTLQPKTVDLVFEPANSKKDFTRLQPEVKGLAQGHKAMLPAEGITLTLVGTPTALAGIKPGDIGVAVDVTGLPPGDYTREVTVTLPPQVKLQSTAPIQIPVRIVAQ